MKSHKKKYGDAEKKIYISKLYKLCGLTYSVPHLTRAGCELCGTKANLNKQLIHVFFQRVDPHIPSRPNFATQNFMKCVFHEIIFI